MAPRKTRSPPPPPVEVTPPRPSPWAHILDTILFRLGAIGVLYHELVSPQVRIAWIVGGFCLFFMPDWLRGQQSVVLRALLRLLGDRER